MNDKPVISDHDLLIRLDAKLDQFISAQADHETRLRLIEAAHDQLRGSLQTIKGLSALLGLFAAIASALGAWNLFNK